jgi:hypothetical protein
MQDGMDGAVSPVASVFGCHRRGHVWVAFPVEVGTAAPLWGSEDPKKKACEEETRPDNLAMSTSLRLTTLKR